ncbi:MAG: ComEA family DNA-binding protein [bacterium]|nr:ComEA family DNA-binding protein [Candidatus Microgenomates bacterium CPR3]MCQ3944789.1 ComEA family DNA-binding protein [bacterium]RIK51363.1 MAG: competence protein ComE [Candidatus Microgenomates bacterium]
MEWVKKWGVVGIIGILGIGLIGHGVWDQIKPREVVVEIVKEQGVSDKVQASGEVMVDVAGAVEQPGVYKLPANSRIGDALVVAGGLAAEADREWVAKTLNLAAKVEDGEKVYIPSNSQISNSQITNPEHNQNSNLININTASVDELDSLEGIGETRAKAIVDNRPYSKTEDLVVKAKIPQSVYEKIHDQLSVY